MTRAISVPSLLIGLGAGLASALLFAAPMGGSMLAMPLFFLAPMPLAIAALGWGTPAGLAAVAAGLAAIGLGLGSRAAFVFGLADALPIVVATHLFGLARLADPSEPTSGEWYPLGRVLTAIAAMVSIGVIGIGVVLGFDTDELTRDMLEAFRAMQVHGAGAGATADPAQLEPFVRAMVRIIPVLFPAGWFLVVTLDLWVAARVVAKSGRMARPNEDVAAVELPIAAGLVFAAAFAAMFLDGAIGLVASVITGVLFSAHLLVGLDIVHTLARRSEARIIILAFVYGLALLFSLPLLMIALAGVLEPHFGLRRRGGAGGPN
jgi:hypothetical protein